jgi:hypothetical protein
MRVTKMFQGRRGELTLLFHGFSTRLNTLWGIIVIKEDNEYLLMLRGKEKIKTMRGEDKKVIQHWYTLRIHARYYLKNYILAYKVLY